MRYILKISFDGKNYSGYQVQKDKITIQKIIEDALKQVFKKSVSIFSSGRTDAGVSAICQVCHFDTQENINCKKTTGYLNSLLPKDIRVLSIETAPEDFHARFSVQKKIYEYYFYLGHEIPVYENFATFIGYDLSIEDMTDACKYFIGTHDFSAFCSSNTEVVDKVRTIYEMEIKEVDENLYKMVVCGNGFLYNMVRILMGTLVEVGRGKILPKEIPAIIESKQRSNSGKTMPAKGLYLKKIIY